MCRVVRILFRQCSLQLQKFCTLAQQAQTVNPSDDPTETDNLRNPASVVKGYMWWVVTGTASPHSRHLKRFRIRGKESAQHLMSGVV